MKLAIISDTHFEFGRDPEAVVGLLPDADVCILAGDIAVHRFIDQSMAVMGFFCKKYPNVVYVPGNHEYYGSRPPIVHGILNVLANEYPNLTILMNRVAVINDQRFIGGTLWFNDHPMNAVYKHMLNDFDQIRGFEPWVYEQNKDCADMLNTLCQPGDIVVTHHLPSYASVPAVYKNSELNRFYVSAQDEIVWRSEPKLWVHGHTHYRNDYMLGKTRVICNPLGYPFEPVAANLKLTVEV